MAPSTDSPETRLARTRRHAGVRAGPHQHASQQRMTPRPPGAMTPMTATRTSGTCFSKKSRTTPACEGILWSGTSSGPAPNLNWRNHCPGQQRNGTAQSPRPSRPPRKAPPLAAVIVSACPRLGHTPGSFESSRWWRGSRISTNATHATCRSGPRSPHVYPTETMENADMSRTVCRTESGWIPRIFKPTLAADNQQNVPSPGKRSGVRISLVPQ